MFDSSFLWWTAFLQDLGTANIYIHAELEACESSEPCGGAGSALRGYEDISFWQQRPEDFGGNWGIFASGVTENSWGQAPS